MSAIEVRELAKAYGATPVLHALELTVPDGSITAVLGSSGSGKTTLLRVIAGFEDADSGSVSIGGNVVDDGRRTVRPQHRAVGYVPQDAALFPHLTVASNVGFGVPRRQRRALAELISLVGLSGLEHRYPHQLSGGQRQRVALARALAIQPRVVLLDEPFGSLDAALRETVRAEVIGILAETGTTTMLVTHDQDEALSLADHVALLDSGRIVAHGSPRELYAHPSSPEVATAIGTANILTGRVDGTRIRCELGELAVQGRAGSPGAYCQLLLRPEQLLVDTFGDDGGTAATVVRIRYHGHDTLVDLTVQTADGSALIARVADETVLHPGQTVWLAVGGQPHIWF